MKSKIHGTLEIDHDKGIICFNTSEKTILLLIGLPSPIPHGEQLEMGFDDDEGFYECNWYDCRDR